MKTVCVPLELIEPDPDQPRKIFDPEEMTALAENIKRVGQQVPGIGYQHEKKVRLLDGERRFRGLTFAGEKEMTLVLLPERPTKAQLRIIQNSLDVHRVSLNLMERSNLLAEIQRESGWGVTEMASQLSMKQSLCTKYLFLQKFTPELQGLVATGAINDLEKACVLNQLPDHASRIAAVKDFGHLSRDEFKAKVKSRGKSTVKAKRAVFMLPGGASIAFKGEEATLEDVIERLTETLKELRKGLSQSYDITTVQRVFRDKAKVNHVA